MAAQGGFVYVLSNECMPGIVKVGCTSRLPSQRASELFTTGVPVPFEIEAAFYVKDMSESETCVHNGLSKYRVNGSREFFKCSVEVAVGWAACESLADYGLVPVPDPYVVEPSVIDHLCGVLGCNIFHFQKFIKWIPDGIIKILGEKWGSQGLIKACQEEAETKRLEVTDG